MYVRQRNNFASDENIYFKLEVIGDIQESEKKK